MGLFGGLFSSPKPPDPPDYAAAAKEQGAANKDAAIAGSFLNNPNVSNPYGTQTWTDDITRQFDPEAYKEAVKAWEKGGGQGPQPVEADFYRIAEVGRPTMTQVLSPEQQALYDKQTQTQANLGDLGIQGSEALRGVVGTGLDLSGASAVPQSYDATRQRVIDAMMSRADEDYGTQRDQIHSDLIAAGLRPGTPAYDNRMQMLERSRTDARMMAEAGAGAEVQRAFGTDTARRKDEIAEIIAQRQTPLNELNALMSGSQVTNPFSVPGASQNNNVAPAPLFGAAQAQYGASADAYNAQQQQRAGLMGGLFSLGSAYLGA